MPKNWKTYPLDELLDQLIDYRGKTPVKTSFGIPLITAKIVKGGRILDPNEFIAESHYENWMTRGFPKIGDVLLTVEAPLGEVAQLQEEKVALAQRIVTLRGKEGELDNTYLKYFLLSDIGQVRLKARESGTTVFGIKQSELRKVEIDIPSFPEQTAIASILSALDDKIEINLQQNKTLEEMAMALYKHWFVDFGPFKDGKFIDSELGRIPEGWEVKSIGELIETVGGGTPRTNIAEYWDDGEIDWYSPTDLTSSKSLFSLGTAKKITELGLQKSSSRLFPSGCLLMSSRATIGALTINRKESCTNQGFITMIPNDNISVYQLHGWTKDNADLILSKANGSTFKEISKSEFRALPFLQGKGIKEYIKQSEVIYSLIENHILENQTLIEQRDFLLPKLISGEIKVEN